MPKFREDRPPQRLDLIGAFVRGVRLGYGGKGEWGQRRFAERCDVDAAYLNRLENGNLSQHGRTTKTLDAVLEQIGAPKRVINALLAGKMPGGEEEADYVKAYNLGIAMAKSHTLHQRKAAVKKALLALSVDSASDDETVDALFGRLLAVNPELARAQLSSLRQLVQTLEKPEQRQPLD